MRAVEIPVITSGLPEASLGVGSIAHAARRTDDRLVVRLLGPVEVTWRGRPVRLPGSAATALLALLALKPRPQRREALAVALWPDGGVSSYAWLRQALWQLRRALGAGADEVIASDAESIGLRASLALDVDVRAFVSALGSRPPALDTAVRLYRGDLVDGMVLECFAWDRQRLNDLHEDALADLGNRCLAEGDVPCALDAGLGLVERDPLREEAHALLIEVYGLMGSRSQVYRQYRRLSAILDEELGVGPLPETTLAYERALARTWQRSARRVGLTRREPDDQPTSPVGFR